MAKSAKRCLFLIVCFFFFSVGGLRASEFFGVTSHFVHNSRFYPEMPEYWRVDNIIPVINELGSRTVHEGLYATAARPRALITDGKTDQATIINVKRNRKQVNDWLAQYDQTNIRVVLAVIGLDPKTGARADTNNEEFSHWIAELVAAHHSIVGIQLHNEPNLKSYWPKGSPEDYVETFRKYAQKIKLARPDVKIYFGATSSLWWKQGVDWLKRAVDAGAFEFSDGVAVHPYNLEAPPESDPHWNGGYSSDPDHREHAITSFYEQLKQWNGGKPTSLIFTEFGWDTSSAGKTNVSEATQAAYLARSFLIYADTKLHGVPLDGAFWYDLKDDGLRRDKPEHNFGLVTYNLKRRKPAFEAFRSISHTFGNIGDFSISELKVEMDKVSGVKRKSWKRSDGTEYVILWSVHEESPTTINLKFPGRKFASVKIHYSDEREDDNYPVAYSNDATEVSVQVSGHPIWLELVQE